MGPLAFDPFGVASIAAADAVVDEGSVGGEIGAQQHGIGYAHFRWTCGLSIAPSSWATPAVLRLGVMPQ